MDTLVNSESSRLRQLIVQDQQEQVEVIDPRAADLELSPVEQDFFNKPGPWKDLDSQGELVEQAEPSAAVKYFQQAWLYVRKHIDRLRSKYDGEYRQEKLTAERRRLFIELPKLLSKDEAEERTALQALKDQPVTIHDQTYVLRKLLGCGTYGAAFAAELDGSKNNVVVKLGRPIDRTLAMKRNPADQAEGRKVMEARSIIIELASLFKLTGKKPATEPLPFARYIDAQYLPDPDTFMDRSPKQIVAIVQELVVGQTLKQTVQEQNNLQGNEEKLLDYAQQLLAAVRTMHAAGVLHLDIKPGNVMVQSDDTIKLIDFGGGYLEDHVQRAVPWAERLSSQFTPAYTRYQELGTFTQARDAYSTGITIYDMIYGLNSTPVSRAKAYPQLSEKLQRLSTVADQLANRNPAQRWAIDEAEYELREQEDSRQYA